MVIEVFDSRTYTYIYGHIVVKAAEMREQGESFEAITSVIRSRLSRVEAYLGVYTLKYLKKSGRISGGAAFVGEALGLKPISFVYDGAVKVCDKVRGEKALAAGICKKVAARVQQPDGSYVRRMPGADAVDCQAQFYEEAYQANVHSSLK